MSSLHSLLMQLCALETHIRILRYLKIFVDLIRYQQTRPQAIAAGSCHRETRHPSPHMSG